MVQNNYIYIYIKTCTASDSIIYNDGRRVKYRQMHLHRGFLIFGPRPIVLRGLGASRPGRAARPHIVMGTLMGAAQAIVIVIAMLRDQLSGAPR